MWWWDLKTAVAVGTMAVMLVGQSQASEQSFFLSGTHVCEGRTKIDDWRITASDDGSWRVDVYYRTPGYDSFQTLRLTGRPSVSNFILSDRNGRPKIAVSAANEGDSLTGMWLGYGGKPENECVPFRLERTDSAQARFDTLLQILTVEQPTPEDAKKAAVLTRRLPPLDFLPDLDQSVYRQNVQKGSPPFWQRFRKGVTANLAAAPLGALAEREAAIALLRAATAFDVTPSESYANDYVMADFAVEAQRMLADRLDQSGQILPRLVTSTGSNFCERLSAFNYPDLKKLELVVGQPSDYWDRSFAESLIGLSNACKNGSGVVSTLKSAWPRIDKRREDIIWIKQQRDHLLALPVSLKSFRDSNWLTVDRDALNQRRMDSDLYDRFIGAPLETRRKEMAAASLAEIDRAFSMDATNSLPADKAQVRCAELLGDRLWGGSFATELSQHCNAAARTYVMNLGTAKVEKQSAAILASPRTLDGLLQHNWFALDRSGFSYGELQQVAVDAFDAKVAPARAEAFAAAMREITEGFASIDPLAKTTAPVVEACQKLPYGNDETLRSLAGLCRTQMEGLHNRADTLRCEKALAASGAKEAVLTSMIEAQGAPPAGKVSVKDLICAAARRNLLLSFPTTGLIWTTQKIELRTNNKASSEPADFNGTLEEVSDQMGGKFWRLKEFSKLAKTPGPRVPPTDQVIACLLSPAMCPL